MRNLFIFCFLCALGFSGCSTRPSLAPAAEVPAKPSVILPEKVVPVRPATDAAILATELLGHIEYLSSPALEGRETGTRGATMAAEYIAGEFARYGLHPVGGTSGSSSQAFIHSIPFPMGLVSGSRCALRISTMPEKTWKIESDWVAITDTPTLISATGPLVLFNTFQGNPNTDALTGAWTLIFHDPKTQGATKGLLRTKIEHCQNQGAIGVIISNPTEKAFLGNRIVDPADQVLLAKMRKEISATIPVIRVSSTLAKILLAPSKMDQSSPSASISSLVLNVTIQKEVKSLAVSNVLGLLPGSDPILAQEILIIGAHYDHVGMGSFSSRIGAAGKGKLHPGADDNASGVAGLLEIAQALVALDPGQKPKRSVLFIAFSGEEWGCIGSDLYVREPAFPLKDTVGMINLDMIGRSPKGKFIVSGTNVELDSLVSQSASEAGNARISKTGPTPGSDNVTFTMRGIPTIALMTGLHADYHGPTDTWDKIDAPTAATIARFAMYLAKHWADFPDRIPAPRMERRPVLGVNLGDDDGTCTINSVAPGSGAEKAGIVVGDTITAMEGKPIKTSQDLIDAIRRCKVGQTISVQVERHGTKISLSATLGQ
jgi:aminopeptidase YwaD